MFNGEGRGKKKHPCRAAEKSASLTMITIQIEYTSLMYIINYRVVISTWISFRSLSSLVPRPQGSIDSGFISESARVQDKDSNNNRFRKLFRETTRTSVRGRYSIIQISRMNGEYKVYRRFAYIICTARAVGHLPYFGRDHRDWISRFITGASRSCYYISIWPVVR